MSSLFVLATFAVNYAIHAVNKWKRRLPDCVDTESDILKTAYYYR